MATTIKTQMSKFMIALALAAVASLFGAGSAFANVTVDVTFPDPNSTTGGTLTAPNVQIDKAGVQNTGFQPVTGMFYKTNAWNVLTTGTAAGQYASWDNILTEAVNVYNTTVKGENDPTIGVQAVKEAATNNTLSLTATDGAYKKYYPNSVDLDGTSTGAGYFYDSATNNDTTLTSLLRNTTTNKYTLLTANDSDNPNGVGAVFAWRYGADAATTTEIEPENEGDDPTYVYETAGTAAQRAAGDIEEFAHPRLIMGCKDNWTTSDAMGKRYCTNITGITLS